jgi:hypothetical protein
LLSILFLLFFTGVQSSATPPQVQPPIGVPPIGPDDVATLGEPFSLPWHGGAVVGAGAVTIYFADVVEDSRCPTLVTCAWSGIATVALSVATEEQPATTLLLSNISLPDNRAVDVAYVSGYEIAFVDLAPRAQLPEDKMVEEAYVLTLLVKPLSAGACPLFKNDPAHYLRAICQYIVDNEIDVSPADPMQYAIKDVQFSTAPDGRETVWVFLNCCYMGDYAIIDVATGEVLKFRAGAQ